MDYRTHAKYANCVISVSQTLAQRLQKNISQESLKQWHANNSINMLFHPEIILSLYFIANSLSIL